METTALIVALIFFTVGLLGSVLPVLPGTALVWAGIVIHRLWMGDLSVSWTFVIVGLVIVIISQLLDILFTWWGARRFGASWKGAAGAVIGAIVGTIFFSLPGMFLGPVIGAVVAEYLNHGQERAAVRAGIGAVVGGLVSLVVNVVMTAGLIVAFFLALPKTPIAY